MNLHFNTTQDLGHGVMIIFICCILIIVACLIDLWTGVEAARKNRERIKSRILRRTVNKITDYLRVIMFGVLIDILGLCFPWYAIPYSAIVVTLGILLIEGKSVIENFHKSKSSAARVVDMIEHIIDCGDSDKAEKIIRAIKADATIQKKEDNNG
ncbi:MAG: phage holin family protein [Bacteroidales bacterium]|nr:phage holin family protein [Bacteroidales bacterium]